MRRTERIYRENVALVADRLDLVRPGWINRVDLQRLRQIDGNNCVVAQAFGGGLVGYRIGRKRLQKMTGRLPRRQWMTIYPPPWRDALCTEIWRREIRRRRVEVEAARTPQPRGLEGVLR